MELVDKVCYLVLVAMFIFTFYRVDDYVATFFDWLKDFLTVGGEIINRLDRVAHLLQDLSREVHTNHEFLSSTFLDENMERTQRETMKIVMGELTKKNGKLKKAVANDIVKLVADELARKNDEPS